MEADKPPFFSTWSRAYVFVLSALAVEVVLFAWLSWSFR